MSKDFNGAKAASNQGPVGFVLFVAYIGAVVYFFQQSPTFWGFVVSLFKAAVWPAFVLYQVLQSLHV